MKKLIAYYSRAGQNYFGGNLKFIEKGNTEIAAEKLQALTKADLFKIEQVKEYSEDYKMCVAEAKEDLQNNARPELKNVITNMDEYDEIYLGYPNYCGTMPQAVFTFLESYDLSGKKIHPFCTNEGSGLGNSIKDLEKTIPSATLEKGLSIFGSRVNECDSLLKEWLGE